MALRCCVRQALARCTPAAANRSRSGGLAARSLATVRYAQTGDPYKVLTQEDDKQEPAKSLGKGQVELKILFAPVNGNDIAQIEGTKDAVASLPAVAGQDALAEVLSTGPGVSSLKKGDWVVPLPGSQLGTWRASATASEGQLQKVPSDIPGEYASCIGTNAAAAYRMLRDFKTLKAGDVIIHSAANSTVGLAVVQMAKKMGVKVISVVRVRPQEDDTMQVVVAVGSDIIVYEDYLHTPEFYTLIADLPAPCLALDAVGGSVGADLARALGDGATFVSYGELSGAAARLPASVVKAKGIKTADFCITKWTKGSSAAARQSMVDDIGAMIKAEELILFFEAHPFSNISYALDRYYEPFKYRKVLLDMSI
ncbi:trans-2-enoyl-CoA reductase mitochondrial precursor [Tribonema minus]|uniref:Trans-2-enoyl-CoA reductase mitochondrial n=1 Tax=Tribonema minus TaxID=303371 RepID=A0A836CBQ4_9STRA|nr:trans-2-enoyl-CoA reductase mitochondrial precursor [Tribonema minus]